MRLLRDRSGAAALEFAIVAQVFLMLLIGAIQIGLLMWTANGLQETAMLTARCAALGSCSDPKSFAISLAQQLTFTSVITADDVTISSSSICEGASSGYGHFTMVTITSEAWAGHLIQPLSGASPKASACYPSPTGS